MTSEPRTTRGPALVFMDTETTGLALTDDIWEFAAIRREPDGQYAAHHLFIEHSIEKCVQLPAEFLQDHENRYNHMAAISRYRAAEYIDALFHDAPHIVGARLNFDTERLALLLKDQGFQPKWHYHLIDVENLAVGYLYAQPTTAETYAALALPWSSDALSRAVGVQPPGPGVRHTALGDAKWAMDMYDAITKGGSHV